MQGGEVVHGGDSAGGMGGGRVGMSGSAGSSDGSAGGCGRSSSGKGSGTHRDNQQGNGSSMSGAEVWLLH